MKYIVFELKGAAGKPTMHAGVTFPDVFMHKEVAEAIETLVRALPEGPMAGWWAWPKPVSAGFIRGGVCHGKSESLNLSSHPEDSLILDACKKTSCATGFKER